MLLLTEFVNSSVTKCHFSPLSISLRNRVSELTVLFLHVAGTKIIFWDLRDQFIDNLYKPRVCLSRLEPVIEPLDAV